MLRERILLGHALLSIELDGARRYRLSYGGEIEYTPDRRRVGTRTTPYVFRSVEQLRYDFECDVEASGGVLD